MSHVIERSQGRYVYRVEATQVGYIAWVECEDRVLEVRRFNTRGPDAHGSVLEAYAAVKNIEWIDVRIYEGHDPGEWFWKPECLPDDEIPWGPYTSEREAGLSALRSVERLASQLREEYA
jgi:hypothetical protein